MMKALAGRHTSVKTSWSSSGAPPPAGLAEEPKLNAILRWPKSAETECEGPLRGELGRLGALSDGEVGEVGEKERRWSGLGLRLNKLKVRAKILRQLLSVERRCKLRKSRDPVRSDGESSGEK